MNEQTLQLISKYSGMLSDKGYLRSGFVAVKEDDGILITVPAAHYGALVEDEVKFVSDKNIEELDGNFRAAAVILFCVMRQSKDAQAAAIVDSESILDFSTKRKPLAPILDDLAQICGISIKSATKNVASEVVSALSGLRNACFLPDAGAVVTGRTLDEVFTCTLVLDKACNAEKLAGKKGGTESMSKLNSVLEHVVYKLKYSKKNTQQHQQAEQEADAEGKGSGKGKDKERQTAIVTDEEKRIAAAIKDTGVRMLEENLVQGTWGNIAVKLDEQFMLATPSGLDYVLLKPEQIAKVNMDTLEWTGLDKATSEKGIHAVLLKGEGVGATIHSHPFYGCILAAMNKAMPVPEKYRDVLGDEIPCAAAALPGTKGLIKNVSAAIGNAPACFLAHHGVIARGKDLEDTLNICRALENACRDYLTE